MPADEECRIGNVKEEGCLDNEILAFQGILLLYYNCTTLNKIKL